MNYLVNVTYEPNVSIPTIVKNLMRRARDGPDWSIVFKSLVTIHHLMTYGNEKFIQNLASSSENCRLFKNYLSSFNDTSSVLAYDMSISLRRYAQYLSLRIRSYKSLGKDFCRAEKQTATKKVTLTDDAIISYDKLILTLPIVQELFDLLIAFDVNMKDLNNGIINMAFAMLYKDFVKLYIVYQSLIIKLLDKYFVTRQLKQVELMLKNYRKFLVRMEKVSDFMRIVDMVGLDKSDMPNLSRSPSLPLKLLENYQSDLQRKRRTKRDQIYGIMSRNYGSVDLPKLEIAGNSATSGYGTLQLSNKKLRRRLGSLSGDHDTVVNRLSTPKPDLDHEYSTVADIYQLLEPVKSYKLTEEVEEAAKNEFESEIKEEPDAKAQLMDATAKAAGLARPAKDDDHIFSTDYIEDPMEETDEKKSLLVFEHDVLDKPDLMIIRENCSSNKTDS